MFYWPAVLNGLLRLANHDAGMGAMRSLRIRAIAFEDEKTGHWIAQCLEYDIAAQAPTITQLRTELDRVLITHALIDLEQGEEPFSGLPQAPERFFQMYDESNAPVEVHRREILHPELRTDVPRPEMIPLVVPLRFEEATT